VPQATIELDHHTVFLPEGVGAVPCGEVRLKHRFWQSMFTHHDGEEAPLQD